jgi:hypothetical protein
MGGTPLARYAPQAMNQNPSTETSLSSSRPSADSISRRAYELWEQEGRPEGNDMRHWLQAEQELAGGKSTSNGNGTTARSDQARQQASDARPLQGTRAGAAANRDSKRSSASPFGTEKAAAGQNPPRLDTAGNRRRN